MPNYRQKNRNKNKNKNKQRNKPNNNNNNNNNNNSNNNNNQSHSNNTTKAEQQAAEEQQPVATSSHSSGNAAAALATPPHVAGTWPTATPASIIATTHSNNADQIPNIVASTATTTTTTITITTNSTASFSSSAGKAPRHTPAHAHEAATNTNYAHDVDAEVAALVVGVCNEADARIASTQEVEPQNITQRSVLAMGANSTKPTKQKTHAGALTQQQQQQHVDNNNVSTYVANTITTQSTPLGKVIVHRIVRETADGNDVELPAVADVPAEQPVKVFVHQITLESDSTEPAAPSRSNIGKHEPATAYQVESPKNVADGESHTRRFVNFEQEVQIQELSETSSGEFNVDNPPLISEVDSESETCNELAQQELANSTRTRTQHGNLCIEMLASEPPDSSAATQSPSNGSASAALQAEQQQQRRAQKRQALESHFLPQMLSPRYLDCILEENSDMSDARSDCSEQPLSRSASASDATQPDSAEKAKRANAVFPKSQLDFSKRHKHGQLPKLAPLPLAIREEPVTLKLETRLVEPALAEETCTRLASMLSPASEEAELVYINSASSSMSDLHELEPDETAQRRASIDLDTDVHELINPPASEQREATPVNQLPASTSPALDEQLRQTIDSINADIAHEHELLCALAAQTIQPTHTNNEQLLQQQQQQQQQEEEEERAYYHKSRNESANSGKCPNERNDSFSLSVAVGGSARCEHSSDQPVREMEKVRELLASEDNHSDSYSNGIVPAGNAKHTQLQPRPHSYSLATAQPNELKQFLKSQNSAPLTRQASNESHCSDSTTHSQCTAIHVPAADEQASASDSVRDLDHVIISDTTTTTTGTETGAAASSSSGSQTAELTSPTSPTAIKKLRLLCTESLAAQPYGEAVLEELATVAQNIGEARAIKSAAGMPYPIPDLPHIDTLQLSLTPDKLRSPTPPPVPAPPQDYANGEPAGWLGVPTQNDPKLLVCLSPAQRTLVTPVAQQTDALLDAHQKFIERRGYHELSEEQVDVINRQKLAEQQLMQTAALMKKLRKSLTPTASPSPSPSPPPLPPPPVPERKKHNNNNNNNDGNGHGHGNADTNAKEQSSRQPTADAAQRHNATDELIAQKSNANGTTTTTTAITTSAQITAPATTATATTAADRRATAQTANFQFNTNASYYDNNNNNNHNNNNNNNQNGDDNNKHRLLEIISDTHTHTKPASSFENSTANSSELRADAAAAERQHSAQTTTAKSANIMRHDQCASQVTTTQYTPDASLGQSNSQLPPTTTTTPTPTTTTTTAATAAGEVSNTMPGMESELARMFPTLGETDIFAAQRKRFSNIESTTSPPYCQQLLSTLPKRHSHHMETHAYESKRRIENGQVVYDCTTSKHDVKDAPDLAALHPQALSTYDNNNNSNNNSNNNALYGKSAATPPNGHEPHEIMSALKLNTKQQQQQQPKEEEEAEQQQQQAQARQQAAPQQQQAAGATSEQLKANAIKAFANATPTTTGTTTTTTHDIMSSERIERKEIINSERDLSDLSGSYAEFRQRAKAAAAATTATAAATPSNRNAYAAEHEKLFKDFDALKEQLHKELESGKAQREQREKSASLYDLNRLQLQQQQQHFDELKRQRHAHMKELELEIERSMRSRQLRQMSLPRHTQDPASTQPPAHVHHIPIQLEPTNAPAPQRTHAIPIEVEPGYQPPPPAPSYDTTDDAAVRFRRAESMFDLSEPGTVPSTRPHTTSSYYNNADDWSRYASDLGSSENIVRPFAREVEICYQRQRPQGIRAPRLTASTNDLTHSYDAHNAYNVRRTHAPMLQSAPQPARRPHYGSCYSMIERNPNPTYISTTSRRGTSPAPPTMPHEQRQRRASLPREIHEQQLKYISSKEEELKLEFERLQTERRRLMDELQNPPTPAAVPPAASTRLHRDSYRAAAPRLPTLSEDEVQRQQMAEEWLNKVAEREERRLQKIIKISKVHEQDALTHAHALHTPSATKPDISEEFLTRVKERRHKLAMPADSDWESGAESQPQTQPGGNASESDEIASVKILEGKTEANLKQMPAHLREFAKFSNHQLEQLANGRREQHDEEERRQEANDNSYSSALKKTSIVKTYKTLRQPLPAVPARRSSHTALASTQNAEPSTVPDVATEASATPAAELRQTATSPTDTATTPSTSRTTSWNDSHADPWERCSAYFGTAATPPTHDALFQHRLPASIDEMFALSPFNRHIREQFQNFWQTFSAASGTPNTARTYRTSLP